MKVVIAGTGNVATVLGRKILAAGNEIIQVVGRNPESTAAIASLLNAKAIYDLLEIKLTADLYIISVSDSSIGEIVAKLKLDNKIVVHTAAAVSKEVLSACSNNYGVLYPLQTLRKELEFVPPIPVLVDGNNLKTKEFLLDFAKDWAESAQVADDDERLKLHVAAVFTNNFTNHLFAVAEQYCTKEGLDFGLLYAIIEETSRRIKDKKPSTVQTGPAIRRDWETIEKHRQVIAAHPQIKELYNILTMSIIDFYEDHL